MTKYIQEDITSIYMSKMRLKYKYIPVQSMGQTGAYHL